MERAELGHRGEAIAAKYYQSRGYLLLGHNYRTRLGELDLIVRKGDLLVFAEVKTRTRQDRMKPSEAVDAFKRRRIIAAAGYYLQHSPFADSQVRFDVVEVVPGPDGWQVHCIMDAFQC